MSDKFLTFLTGFVMGAVALIIMLGVFVLILESRGLL